MTSLIRSSESRELWDPYAILDVYPNGRGGHRSSCVGTNRFGARCGWDLDSEQFSNARQNAAARRLDSMAAAHPSQVTWADLSSLACDTLCRDFHQGQAGAVAQEWQARIDQYVREHGRLLERDTAIGQLRSEIEGAKEEVHRALESSRAEKIKQLEEERATSDRDLARLRQQLAELQTKADTRDEQLGSTVEDLKKQLQESQAKSEKSAAASTKEIQELKDSKAQLNRMLTTATSTKEIKELKDSKAQLNRMLTSTTLENGSLKKEVKDKDRVLGERTKTAEDTANDLRRQLAARDREMASLTQAKEASALENGSLKKEVKDKDRALDERTKISEDTANDLRRQLAAKNREMTSLTQAKEASDEKAARIERKAEDLRRELRESNARNEASTDSKSFDARLEDLRKRHEGSEKGNAARTTQVGEQGGRIAALERELGSLKADSHTRRLDLEQLKEQVEVLNRDLAEREEMPPAIQPRKRGLFGRFSSKRPPRVTVRTISQTPTPESTPYV